MWTTRFTLRMYDWSLLIRVWGERNPRLNEGAVFGGDV
jgi:hypothetical protein